MNELTPEILARFIVTYNLEFQSYHSIGPNRTSIDTDMFWDDVAELVKEYKKQVEV